MNNSNPNFDLEAILSDSETVETDLHHQQQSSSGYHHRQAAAVASSGLINESSNGGNMMGGSSLYKNAHRRRRKGDVHYHHNGIGSTTRSHSFYHDDGEDDEGGSESMYSATSGARKYMYHNKRKFTNVLIKNLRVPIFLFLIVLFWGPSVMRRSSASTRSSSTVFSLFPRFHRQHHSVLEQTPEDGVESGEEEQEEDEQQDGHEAMEDRILARQRRIKQRQKESQHHHPHFAVDKNKEYGSTNHKGEQNGKTNERDRDIHQLQQQSDTKSVDGISKPVLNALRAVKNTDFQLPPRLPNEEDDDKFDPSALSEDEQEELKIIVHPPASGGQEHDEKNNHGDRPRPIFQDFQLETRNGNNNAQYYPKQQQKILSPLEQYKLRTQQEEKQQLQHYNHLYHPEKEHHQEPPPPQQQYTPRQQPRKVQPKPPPPARPQSQNPNRPVKPQQQPAPKPPVAKAARPAKKQSPRQQPKQGVAPPPQQQQRGYEHANRVQLIPPHFRNTFADVWTPIQRTDVPMFWHIPKNGGTTVADIMTHCLDLVSASNIGATEGHGQEMELAVRSYHDHGRYVNVNTASIPGINHAKQMGLASSGLAEVIVLHRLHEGAALFDAGHRARVFCMFRHPVQRAISMFYYLQRAKWEPTYDPSLARMTLLDYANSNKVEENWVTRFLVHQYTGRLEQRHVEIAKVIMRNKMLVGILENFQESLKRFELYFDWWEIKVRQGDPARIVQCQQNKGRASQNKGKKHPNPPSSDPGYQRLRELNWADLQLYNFAKQLFQEQAQLVKNKDKSMI